MCCVHFTVGVNICSEIQIVGAYAKNHIFKKHTQVVSFIGTYFYALICNVYSIYVLQVPFYWKGSFCHVFRNCLIDFFFLS